jgi:hypothetical protein
MILGQEKPAEKLSSGHLSRKWDCKGKHATQVAKKK